MNTGSVEQLNKKDDLNLFKSYKWFEDTFCVALKSTLQEFWAQDFELKLISVSEDDNFFFGGNEYFATRIKLSKQDQFVVRLSKDAVKMLLDESLGETQNFEFEKLTELEGKIVTAFNNSVYNRFKNFLLSNENISDLNGECHLTFIIDNGSYFDIPKIIVTIPKSYLKYEEVFPKEDRFHIGSFPTTRVNIDLFVGKTTLPISDIKSIEREDIIVLEDSNINRMTLLFQENEIGFKVSPDPSLIINFDENNGGDEMGNTQNIWDNIQVDISAEFEQVKISLGEIKQISEGLVLDMGSIYENKVYLKVENKTIASGELVIINDRYGVRVDEVFEDRKEEEAPIKQEAPNPEPVENNIPSEEDAPENIEQEVPEQPENVEGEEFDYKDFDVDDENI